jgi:hypothetical protein
MIASTFEVPLGRRWVEVPLGSSGRALLQADVPFLVRDVLYSPGEQHPVGSAGVPGQVLRVRTPGPDPVGRLTVQMP